MAAAKQAVRRKPEPGPRSSELEIERRGGVLVLTLARPERRNSLSEAMLAALQAAIEAAGLRLRPILMTSLAFVMGVLPLAYATGAGAEMRRAMGVAVFGGMLGVTAFGLFLTPVFYVLLRALTGNRPLKRHGEIPHDADAFGGGAIKPLPAAPVQKDAS